MTYLEPVCFEKNVHFLARDNDLHTRHRSPKFHGETANRFLIILRRIILQPEITPNADRFSVFAQWKIFHERSEIRLMQDLRPFLKEFATVLNAKKADSKFILLKERVCFLSNTSKVEIWKLTLIKKWLLRNLDSRKCNCSSHHKCPRKL